MKSSRHLAAVALMALGGAALSAHAEPLAPLNQTFNASLGVFFLNTDTTIRLDGSGGQHGTEVNFEDDLGLSSQDRFRIDGYWRFADRHKLRFMYFDSKSSSERTIDTEIDYGDNVFPVNAKVRGDIQTQIMELAYEYSFIKHDNFELAGTIGLHNLSIKARLRAQASSSAGQGGIDTEGEAKGDGPLPVIGLRGLWAWSDHWYLDAQAQFFAVSIDEYDGRVEDYKVSVNWQPLDHFGVGLGYNAFVSRLDVDRNLFEGRLKLEYDGPLLFIIGSF